MSAPTSRRAVLCGAGLATMAVAASAMASTPIDTVDGISPELAALIAAAARADREADAFDNTVYVPARAKADAVIAAIPHTAVDIDGDPYWTTANPGSVRVAQRFVDKDPERLRPGTAGFRDLVAASHRRDREATRIRRHTGLTAAGEQSNALSEANAAAEFAVAKFACRTAADLHAKLTFMSARKMDDCIEVLEYILPDAARLVAAGGR